MARGLTAILIILSTDLSRKLKWKEQTYPSCSHKIQEDMEDISLFYLQHYKMKIADWLLKYSHKCWSLICNPATNICQFNMKK